MIIKIAVIFSILILLLIGLIWLIGKGLKQKFGRFDMPQNQLNDYIKNLLPEEIITDVDLPDLRHRIIELGFTDLSEKQIIKELKKILHNEF